MRELQQSGNEGVGRPDEPPLAAAPERTRAPGGRQEAGTADGTGFLPGDGSPVTLGGLYLHLPFCFHKCHYCDFFSVVAPAGTEDAAQDAFAAALVREVAAADAAWSAAGVRVRPRTIFVGGGTPTLLAPARWARLLEALAGRGWLEGVREFSVEANPETVTAEGLATLRAGGVDRLSIGAQSFDRASLKALERWHDPDSVGRAVGLARDAGFDNLSLDLIWAIPGQTLAMLDADLDRLLALGPEHLSAYGLTFEPQTPLAARLRVGSVSEVDEDLQRGMYDRVMQRLDAAGYEHYELSNWARRDASRDLRCAHNLTYWRNGDWLGLGPAAAGHLGGLRYRNRPNLKAWQDALAGGHPPPRVDVERLPEAQRLGERLMLGLRLAEGVDAARVDADLAPDDARREHLADCDRLGFLETVDGRLRLTRAGRFVADAILIRLL